VSPDLPGEEKLAEDQPEAQLRVKQGFYHAYLLRCWCETSTAANGEPAWRFMLITIDEHRVMKGFASLDDLAAHLRDELGIINSSALRLHAMKSCRGAAGNLT
jgi:hypothetical protein